MADTDYLVNIAEGLENFLANSASFQAWVGAANEAEARARIHHGSTVADSPTPLGLVHNLESIRLTEVALGANIPEGDARITLVGKIQDADMDEDGRITDWKNVIIDLDTQASRICLDMKALSRQGGYGSNVVDAITESPMELDPEPRRSLGFSQNMNEASRDLVLTLGFTGPSVG